MDPLTALLALVALAGLGASLWLLVERARRTGERDAALARADHEERARDSFRALAAEALKTSNEEFLKLAQEALKARETKTFAEIDARRRSLDELVTPIKTVLEKTHEEIRRVERGHAGLREQVEAMQGSNRRLREETGKLTQALRKPNVRGRYGEVQLERVVELAGMRSWCDFGAQEAQRDEGGKLQRPDLVVRLPNDRVIVVDAKTPLDHYVDALQASTPEETEALLERYADAVAEQAQRLSRKEYWASLEGSPEFVVMFLPGDQLIDAALERRPKLVELAAEKNILIASPSTLIGLLRAVHVGWREKSVSDSAEELLRLGRELHERAAVVLEHAGRVGEALATAKTAYNRFVSSVDSRLVPTLRKFEEKGAYSAKSLTELKKLEGEPRELSTLRPVELEPKAPPLRNVSGA